MPRHYGLNPVCKTCVFLSKTPFVLLWLESRHLSTSQPVAMICPLLRTGEAA